MRWPGWGIRRTSRRIRQAAIDAAHVEAFTRAPEDVSLRRLVGFGLGPQLKTNFEQIFSAPFLVELLLAELGPEPERDLFFRLHFDGSFQTQSGGAIMAASDPEAEAAAQKWLDEAVKTKTEPGGGGGASVAGLVAAVGKQTLHRFLPDEAARRAGWRRGGRGQGNRNRLAGPAERPRRRAITD